MGPVAGSTYSNLDDWIMEVSGSLPSSGRNSGSSYCCCGGPYFFAGASPEKRASSRAAPSSA